MSDELVIQCDVGMSVHSMIKLLYSVYIHVHAYIERSRGAPAHVRHAGPTSIGSLCEGALVDTRLPFTHTYTQQLYILTSPTDPRD